MTICGTALGIHGTQTDTLILTAGVDTTIGDLLFGTPILGLGAVAIGTDTIRTTEVMVTELVIIMDIGTGTTLALTVSTIHTMVATSSPQPTTLMVAQVVATMIAAIRVPHAATKAHSRVTLVEVR